MSALSEINKKIDSLTSFLQDELGFNVEAFNNNVKIDDIKGKHKSKKIATVKLSIVLTKTLPQNLTEKDYKHSPDSDDDLSSTKFPDIEK